MKLKEVINVNEIIVEPGWFFKGVRGKRIFIKGYLGGLLPEEKGYQWGKNKLRIILTNKDFELYKAEFWDAYGKDVLVCSVYLNDVDIKNYFPEFKT